MSFTQSWIRKKLTKVIYESNKISETGFFLKNVSLVLEEFILCKHIQKTQFQSTFKRLQIEFMTAANGNLTEKDHWERRNVPCSDELSKLPDFQPISKSSKTYMISLELLLALLLPCQRAEQFGCQNQKNRNQKSDDNEHLTGDGGLAPRITNRLIVTIVSTSVWGNELVEDVERDGWNK